MTKMIFRIYHVTQGGHTHCRFFAGKAEGTLGKCGDLTFKNEEFEEFKNKHQNSIDFRPEDPMRSKGSFLPNGEVDRGHYWSGKFYPLSAGR